MKSYEIEAMVYFPVKVILLAPSLTAAMCNATDNWDAEFDPLGMKNVRVNVLSAREYKGKALCDEYIAGATE